MSGLWNFNRAAEILNGEIELLEKISCSESSVRQAVIDREWTGFDEKILEVNQLGAEFAELEEERVKLFSFLGKEQDNNCNQARPFSAIISVLPEDEQRELSRLYRDLKMETLKMKALNETFLAYLNEAKTLAAAYIGAVCPARGGKLYTKKGQTVALDLKSIVFNNRF